MNVQSPPVAIPHPGMRFREFVTLIAAMMAVNAFSIDVMLPALPAIGHALGVDSENQRQWIITGYLLGFGVAQLAYGPLADRYGRKPVLLVGLALFVLFSLLATFATSFGTLLLARAMQGVGAAATRVLSISIVRDCYAGRRMARVMSLAFIVFLTIPIIAPSVGQAILLVAPWPWIFGVLAAFAALVALWASLRLPETLHPEDRRPISLPSIAAAARTTLTTRMSIGYLLGSTIAFGSLVGFINSSQQIFADVFREVDLFPIIFAVIAGFMGLSSYLNASIVERLGTRRVSHTALMAFICLAGLHTAWAWSGNETIVSFVAFQGLTMFAFGLMGSNFNAMAMEPLGHLAGTASSIQGFVSTIGGALIGFAIGQSFNGSVIPLTLGFMLCGTVALVIVLITERGRLFQPVIVPVVPAPPTD